MNLNNFISELRRRNVFRVATAYAIAGWLIIQIADTVFPRLGLPDWTITFIILITVIGFPIALIIAWAFELTPDGLMKSDEVEITESVTAATGKKINRIAIVSLSLVILLLLSERIFLAESTLLSSDGSKIENASIAVLPFVNMSADEGNEYFSDGLSEELLNSLAKIDGIQVAGRTSSFSFKGKNQDLRQIAQELGVKHVLEGSVRKDGNQVRISAQLIQADNGFNLWSETYDRELESIFAIQEEISLQVAEELKVRLLPQVQTALATLPTADVEAYNIYLEATQVEVSRAPDDLQRAIDLYNQAITLDPNFALAHARLSIAYGLLGDYGSIDYPLMIEEMNSHANKAVLLDPELGTAYRALGFYYMRTFQDDAFDLAENAYAKAIELTPNDAFAHNGMYITLNTSGRSEAGIEYLEKAYKLDPLSNPITSNLASIRAIIQKDHKAGLELAEKVIARSPDFTSAYFTKVGILRTAPVGDLKGAFITAHELLSEKPDDLRLLELINVLAADLDLMPLKKAYTDRMLQLYPNNRSSLVESFQAYYFLGLYQENVDRMAFIRQQFGPQVIRASTVPLVFNKYKLGEFEEVISIIDEEWPEIGELNYEIGSYPSDEMQGNALNLSNAYALSLRAVGRSDEADKYISKICDEYYPLIMDEESTDENMTTDDLFRSYMCHIVQEDFASAAKEMEEYYFERNGKASIITNFNFITVSTYIDEPELAEITDRIYEDIHAMRAEVIDYLKEKGEWKEEWLEN